MPDLYRRCRSALRRARQDAKKRGLKGSTRAVYLASAVLKARRIVAGDTARLLVGHEPSP